MAVNGIDVRCSAIVFRRGAVLLVRRTHGGVAVWTLPGGTPRGGESVGACARRELSEETGVSADPSRVAFVLEAMVPGASSRRLDIVFLADGLEPGAEPQAREPGVEPHFVPVDQLNELTLLPPVAGHLRGLLRHGIYRYAPYLGNVWRPADSLAAGPRTTTVRSRGADDLRCGRPPLAGPGRGAPSGRGAAMPAATAG